MAAHRIVYIGPAADAVEVATALADADGVELLSSQPPRSGPGASDAVTLELSVDASTRAVARALDQVRRRLPDGATVELG